MVIEALAWKNLINEQHLYLMQFCADSLKETKTITDTLKDWQQTGSGTNKDGSEILIFRKEFKDTPSWIEWTKSAPFIINEEQKDGSTKRLKTTVVLSDDGKRKCGLCGGSGHNTRTCKSNPQNTVKVEPVKVKGKKICGQCGGIGHNKRTCKAGK